MASNLDFVKKRMDHQSQRFLNKTGQSQRTHNDRISESQAQSLSPQEENPNRPAAKYQVVGQVCLLC